MRQDTRRPDSGNLLVNALIWLTVTILVMAVAFPAAGKIRGDRRIAQLVDLTKEIETACRKYHADTKGYAVEFSPSKSGQYSAPRFHQLSMTQDAKGWRGPYLDHPLSLEDNPFGGAIYLQNNLGSEPANGFQLRPHPAPLTEGPGQFVVYYGVPEDIGQAVDERLDGASDNWKEQGRVEWKQSAGGALVIKLNLNNSKRASK